MRTQAGRAFAAWLEAGDAHAQWRELTWLVTQGLPQLLSIIRRIPASEDTELLRQVGVCAYDSGSERSTVQGIWLCTEGLKDSLLADKDY